MSDAIEELKAELARLDHAIRTARVRRYGKAIDAQRERLPRENLATSAWSDDVPLRTRRRVQRALRALPGPGSTSSGDYRERVFAAIRLLAEAWNGRCLSTAFDGFDVPLRFECARGHPFELLIHGLRVGNWCKRCGYDRRRYSIEDAHRRAELRGGECLSISCANTKQQLRWRCRAGAQRAREIHEIDRRQRDAEHIRRVAGSASNY